MLVVPYVIKRMTTDKIFVINCRRGRSYDATKTVFYSHLSENTTEKHKQQSNPTKHYNKTKLRKDLNALLKYNLYVVFWFMWFMWLQRLDVWCVSEIISNVTLSENYKYWFLSFGFYINWKNIKWRLSTYIWLKLKFSIIKEIVRIRLVFLSK